MSGYQRFELEIASIGIEIDSSIPAELSARSKLFIKAGIESDVQFKIRTGRHNWNDYEIVHTQVSARIRRKGENILKVQYEDGSFRKVRWISRWKKQERLPEAPCLYEIFVPEMSDCIRNINPLMFVELSEFFLRFSAVILHCSIVNFMEDGILFTAPSGTGKSTQADLWEKYKGAEIINGDRGIIRKIKSEYRVFGSPYAGSSKIYKNKSVALKAVVVLKQGQKNRIRRLNKKTAYLYLFSEMSVSEWDREVVERQAQWLEEFVCCVPVYLLECRPDQEAVEILYEELKTGGKKDGQ